MLSHFASVPLQCLPRTPSPSSSSPSSSSISSPLFVSISRSTHLWWRPNRLSDARRCVLLHRGRPDRQIGDGAGGRRYSIVCLMESKTEARVPGADGSKRGRLKLEALNWDHSFVRELPGDPRTDTIPRQVLVSGFILPVGSRLDRIRPSSFCSPLDSLVTRVSDSSSYYHFHSCPCYCSHHHYF